MRWWAEVAIVGAGPAGAATALALARAGRDVLILERSRFPRDKPCGDCANPGSLVELERLGLAERLKARLAPLEIRGWRIESPDGSAFQGDYSDDRSTYGWAVRRRELDHALLSEAQRAGARTIFGFRASTLVRRGARVAGVGGRLGARESMVSARLVVGADGLRSVVRRNSNLIRRKPRGGKIAIVAHLDGVPNDHAGRGELRVRGGITCGYAPLPNGANVTLVVPARYARSMTGDPHSFFVQALALFPDVWCRVACGRLEDRVMVTGPFDWSVRSSWAPGVVLVGDAAGYFDPFTGQGICDALWSARHAARAIERSLTSPRDERAALRSYARSVRSRKRAVQGLQRVIDRVTRNGRAMDAFVRLLRRGEGIAARRLLRAAGDLAHPFTAVDPIVWLRALRS